MIKKNIPYIIKHKTKTNLTKKDFWLLSVSGYNFVNLYERCYYDSPTSCKLSRKYDLAKILAEFQRERNKYKFQKYYELTDGKNIFRFKSKNELEVFLTPQNSTKYLLIKTAPTCQILTEEFFKKYPFLNNPLTNRNSSVELP